MTNIRFKILTINGYSYFRSDTTYVHGHSGAISNILAGTENFGTASNFVITGGLGTGPTKAAVTGGSFGNFTFTGTATMQCNDVFPDVAGNFTCNSASSEFRMAGSVVGNGGFTIIGNFNLSSGIFSFGNGSTAPSLTIKGNINITGGTLQTACTTNPSTNTITLNKAGVQTFIKSGGTITAASSSGRRISIVVENGTTLDFGTNILDCVGSTNLDFTVNSGGTIRLGDPGGIVAQGTSATTGNIRTSSTSIRSFNTGANYEYSGSAAQITGTGLPATVNNLTINNSSTGVTLSAAINVNSTLTMTNGKLITTDANLLTLGSAATVIGGSSSSFISGPMQHTIASTNSTAKTFPLGKGSAYSPVVLTVTQGAATSTTYKAEVFASGIPSRTVPGTISAVPTNRYYALSSSASNIANGSISLVYNSNDAGISTGTPADMRIVSDQGGSAWVDLGPVEGGSSPITSDVNFTALGNFAVANGVSGTTPDTKTVSGTAAICPGSSTNITLTSSQSDVTYDLFKNGVAQNDTKVGDGNDLNWSVSAVGTYTVKTTSAGGYAVALMDGSAVITAKAAPSITGSSLSGASYGQNHGSPAALSVTATGDDLSYQWYSNSTASNTGGTLINGATNASYTPLTSTLGTNYFYVVVSGPCGDPVTSSVSGAISVITPSPIITLTSAANTQHQSRKAGTAISNITYSIANATGATVSTLPAGLSGSYSNGTFTISGTIDNAADLAIANFTVTATALSGYAGEPITATGSISVKSPTAKEICYLVVNGVSANDTEIFPNLNKNINYIVTVRNVVSPAPAASVYDPFDLIILSEIVTGDHVEAVALKNVNKPILSFKAFTYGASGSTRWGWGVANNGLANNGTVTIKQPAHPIFNGISLTDGSLTILSNVSGNGIQVADVTLTGGIPIALAQKTSSSGIATAIHDVPATARGASITQKYLLIPIANVNYNKITPAGLTLINNAIDYLLNGTQFVAEPLQYRTSATGNLSAITWESSYDGTNWSADVQRPQTGNNSSVRASAGSALNINSDIAMEELVIEATATVNVLPSQKLTLTQGLNNAGTLRLQSNSSGTATVLMPAASNSGNTFVEQYLPQGRNWYVGAPVQTSSASVLTAENLGSTVSYYNEPTAAWVNNYSGALTPGKGYVSVSSTGSNTANATFEGTLNNGEITVALTRKGASKAGFNLIANPYPSYLNAMAAINANSNVEPTIWYRTRSSAYHFETVNTASGVGTNVSGQGLVTGYIPPMQAFWVRTTADEQSITFNNGMRHHAMPLVGETTIATTPLRAKAVANTVIRLRVENATNTDEMVIYTHAAAQNAFDKFDSQKMSNDNPSIAEIYSIVDGRQLVINGLNEINSESTIALGVKANAGNNLRISASEMQQIPSNCDLILFDKLLQTEHLLSENTYYAFEHINNNQRFDLIFRAKGTTTNTLENKARNLIYVNGNKQIVISNNLQTAWAHVYNLAGQMVHSELLNKATTILQSQLKPGVYIVSIDNNKQKIVIE